MRLRNVREIAEQVVDGEFEGDSRVRVTLADHCLEIFVLLDEFVLHTVPDDLQQHGQSEILLSECLSSRPIPFPCLQCFIKQHQSLLYCNENKEDMFLDVHDKMQKNVNNASSTKG